ncbi:MAG: DUF6785 family protein [Armatimonadota bacterium]
MKARYNLHILFNTITESTASSECHVAEQPTRWAVAGIRPQLALLILLTQVVMVWWVADSEIARSIYLICYSLMMPTALYLLFARLLRRWLPFDRRELLMGYIVLTCTIPIIGFGGLRFILPGMGFFPYFSQTQPQWNRYLPYLANLPILHDSEAIQSLYRGQSGVPWQAWVVPVLFWSLYLLLLTGIWIGLAGLLHRIWNRQERLTFPIAVLPLQLTDLQDDLLRRPLFWLGFAIPAVLQSLLVLHDWYPAIPAVQLKATYIKIPLFQSPPWNAFPDFPLGIYPMAVGLAYFVPSSISFSCWFFWLGTRLLYVVGSAFGLEVGDTAAARFPYKEEQAAGAWIAFALMVGWGARWHWQSLKRHLTPDELHTVRWLGLLALGCFLLCAGMMMLTGIPPLFALLIIGVYVAYMLSGARIRAEAGGQWTFAPATWTPHRVANAVLGTQNLSEGAIVAGGYFDLVHVDIRAQSLPYLMEGMKIADSIGLRWRTVLVWVAIGTVTALAVGWWSSLSNFYALGAATAKSNAYAMWKVQYGMQQMHSLAETRSTWDRSGVLAACVGGGFTLLLASLRMRLNAFPLHPVGYVMANTITMNAFFLTFLVAWTAKVLVQRFGGSKGYRRSLAFFVGVTLGDIVTQAGWALIGKLFNVPIYQFLT